MYCSNCGKELSENDRFCRYCGTENLYCTNTSPPPQTHTLKNESQLNATQKSEHSNSINKDYQIKETDYLEKFSQWGITLAIFCITCFILLFITAICMTVSPVNSSDSKGTFILVAILFFLGVLFGILGIIFSSISLNQRHSKRIMSLTGLTLNIVFTAIYFLFIIIGAIA